MVGRALPANCGAAPARLATGINNRKHEAKNDVVIPAVPLRSLPTTDVKRKSEKTVSSHDKDCDKEPTIFDNTVHQKYELRKRELDELEALIAEAEEFMNLLDARCPMSKDHQPPSLESDALQPRTSDGELMIEIAKLEKRAKGEALAMPDMRQRWDESFSGKRLKVNCGISVMVQEEKASGTETMWENGDDEVCVLSPAEWSLSQQYSNHKDECAKPPIRKPERKPERQSLHGLRGQSSSHGTHIELVNGQPSSEGTEVYAIDDISQGKEKFKVGVVNELDEDLPQPFTYITSVVYPPQHGEAVGCDCINGCSDSVQCTCVIKNGGEIPFTEEGLIMRAKPKSVVHECGDACKCPKSCMNRVSQHGPRFQLEIFKTKSMGWGVRSRDYIKPGSFICEYIGELVGEKEAEKRIGNDEYLFDVCHGKSKKDDIALDAAECGNIGRFINHSCDPNVFAQKVVYDNNVLPHIMFFAGKRIPPRTELRYDYNYSNMRIRDANGKIKTKACYCGSRKCSGRLY